MTQLPHGLKLPESIQRMVLPSETERDKATGLRAGMTPHTKGRSLGPMDIRQAIQTGKIGVMEVDAGEDS